MSHHMTGLSHQTDWLKSLTKIMQGTLLPANFIFSNKKGSYVGCKNKIKYCSNYANSRSTLCFYTSSDCKRFTVYYWLKLYSLEKIFFEHLGNSHISWVHLGHYYISSGSHKTLIYQKSNCGYCSLTTCFSLCKQGRVEKSQ